jgi:hypothetical protein
MFEKSPKGESMGCQFQDGANCLLTSDWIVTDPSGVSICNEQERCSRYKFWLSLLPHFKTYNRVLRVSELGKPIPAQVVTSAKTEEEQS